MVTKPFDLIAEIRLHRNDKVHNLCPGGSAGLALRIIYRESSQRVTTTTLLALLSVEREKGTILIVGKKVLPTRGRLWSIIECPLDSGVLESRFWKRLADGTEECFADIRVYVLADGLPASIAGQGRVKRWLSREA